MKGNYSIVLAIVVIAVSAYLLWVREDHHTGLYDELQGKVHLLESKNELLKQQNSFLDKAINSYKNKADSLQTIITENEKNIEQIKQTRNERIAVIDTLDNDELFEFFAGFDTQSAVH